MKVLLLMLVLSKKLKVARLDFLGSILAHFERLPRRQ